ncbi:Uncharacterized protein YecA [hydrothermal vent metagenome]|uniref:Uncharacterized protein YecA n=1 Tax=hydrothermal vent metagenome TaxID=652676 RepID=A0A3B0ZAR4_9ZZZZ
MTDKTKMLLGLGEVQDHADWMDYSALGFDEADVDALLTMVGDESLHQADNESIEIWAPLHAWRALGQIGSVKAVEPLLALFDRLAHDDWALPELSQVMGMIGAHAIPALSDYLKECEHDEFARVMAMDGLFEIAAHDNRQQDEVIRILREYICHPDKETRYLNGLTVSRLVDLNADQAIDDIRKLFDMHCIDITCNGDLEEVEIQLGLRSERATPKTNWYELDKADCLMQADEVGIGDMPDTDDIYALLDALLMRYGNKESVLDVSELDGFFAALACAPSMVLPSDWMPAIWGGEENMPEWESQAEIQSFSSAAFALYNGIMEAMNIDDYDPLFHQREVKGDVVTIVDEWCSGFLRGVNLWGPLPSEDYIITEDCLTSIRLFATEKGFEKRDTLSDEEIEVQQELIAPDVRRLFGHFLKKRHVATEPVVRSAPKVGRNDPCPCGSGKKFKKCCLH